MYLGLDLGTSALKGVLIDDTQTLIGSATAPLSVSRPHPGWSEQDPQNWINAASHVIENLLITHPSQMKKLRGIGLSGQMHGATLIDKSHRFLRPSILWNDTRSAVEASTLDADPRFRALTGNIVFPGFTAPKLLWVQRHEPQLFAQVHKVLLPKDALRLWLSGECISDMSDSAGTSWLDVAKRDWSDDLLAPTSLTRAHMPELAEGNAPAGRLRDSLATRWGLPKGVVIAAGAGDNAASAIGLGVVQAGQAFVSLGTSGVLFAANDSYRPKPESAVHTFCHALPDTWHQMGVILSATDALEWFARLTGVTAADLTRALGNKTITPGAVRFLPYLGGERTPHNDAEIRGAFVGLSHADDRPALTRAVLEGVAFALRDSLEALKSTGTAVERVLAVGGGANSPQWLEIIANTLGVPVDVAKDSEAGAALGAARLGMMAASGASPQDVCFAPETETTHTPDPALKQAFDEAYQNYAATYPALKGI